IGFSLRLGERAALSNVIRRTSSRTKTALERQRGQRGTPAVTDLAYDPVARQSRIGEEDLVERGVVVHLPQRSHVDTRLVHGQDKIGQAAVLGQVPVCSRKEH